MNDQYFLIVLILNMRLEEFNNVSNLDVSFILFLEQLKFHVNVAFLTCILDHRCCRHGAAPASIYNPCKL